MRNLASIAILLLAFGQLNAEQKNKAISKDCLYGVTAASACCKRVPYSQDVLLRNPKDCHTFYQCVHEVPLLRECAADLHWSVKANQCEWPDKAGCQGSVATSPAPTPSSTPRTTTPSSTTPGDNCGPVTPPPPPTNGCKKGETSAEECCKGVPYWQDVLLPNPEDCGSYIQCVHEKPMVRPCPSGLHWSVEANRCEWPNIAKCAGNGGTGGGNGGGSSEESGENGVSDACRRGEVSAKVCCKGVPYNVDVLLKNPADCGTYYQCVHEEPWIRPCPSGLHWSVERNRCEWPNIAKCQ